MDEMELIQWITRLKKTVSELEEENRELLDDIEDLKWQNEQLQQIIHRQASGGNSAT